MSSNTSTDSNEAEGEDYDCNELMLISIPRIYPYHYSGKSLTRPRTMKNSSHHTFRMIVTRTYILKATRIEAIASETAYTATRSRPLSRSPPGGSGMFRGEAIFPQGSRKED